MVRTRSMELREKKEKKEKTLADKVREVKELRAVVDAFQVCKNAVQRLRPLYVAVAACTASLLAAKLVICLWLCGKPLQRQVNHGSFLLRLVGQGRERCVSADTQARAVRGARGGEAAVAQASGGGAPAGGS